MRKHLFTACLYTVVTAFLLGIAYPLLITGIAQLAMRDKANGQLIFQNSQNSQNSQNGEAVGSALIGQPFNGPGYFHTRPSAAGTGYDASASSGSNDGPTNKALVDRVAASVKSEGNGTAVPIDLVTASGSGLDPDITIAAALYQVQRVAQERHLSGAAVTELVRRHITPRQLGLFGEPRVNVLHLNLALQALAAQQ